MQVQGSFHPSAFSPETTLTTHREDRENAKIAPHGAGWERTETPAKLHKEHLPSMLYRTQTLICKE